MAWSLVPPGHEVSGRERRTLRLSLADGLFYAVMVGFGETYFLADAVRLHASVTEIGLLVALPLCIGGAGPIGAYFVYRRLRRCRVIVVVSACAQVIVLAALAASEAIGVLTPGRLILAACVYQIAGQACGTTWANWIGDLVPATVRAHYFARRQGYIYLVSFLSLLSAGGLLQILERAQGGAVHAAAGRGFQVIFAVAAVARLGSMILLSAMPEAEFTPLPTARRLFAFQRTQRGRAASRLLGVGAVFSFTVYVSAPYYGAFMLGALHFTYLEYTLAVGAAVVAKVLALRRWGHAIQHHGALQVYFVAIVLVGVIPLAWVARPGFLVVLSAQALSGFAWSGFELAHFTLLLESGYRSTRQYLFTMHNLLSGSAQLAGGLVGAILLGADARGYPVIFAASAVGRLILGLLAPSLLVPLRPFNRVGRGRLLFRLIGLRQAGGLSIRPISTSDPYPRRSAGGDDVVPEAERDGTPERHDSWGTGA